MACSIALSLFNMYSAFSLHMEYPVFCCCLCIYVCRLTFSCSYLLSANRVIYKCTRLLPMHPSRRSVSLFAFELTKNFAILESFSGFFSRKKWNFWVRIKEFLVQYLNFCCSHPLIHEHKYIWAIIISIFNFNAFINCPLPSTKSLFNFVFLICLFVNALIMYAHA